MERLLRVLGALVLSVGGTMIAAPQDGDAIVAAMRAALGGERLGAIETVAISGRSLRRQGDDRTAERGFEMSIALPDRFRERVVVMAMGPTSIYRHTGFNGDAVIDEMDAPPMLAGGGNFVFIRRTDGGVDEEPTAEAVAARRAEALREAQQRFARLAIGWFGGGTEACPVSFRPAGRAESPDGTADVLEVTGPAGFRGRLFVDTATHRPLMLSWQDLEPLAITLGGESGHAGEDVQMSFAGDAPPSPKDVAAAEANRRQVEFRLVYADYETFDGVTWPMRLQRVVDGRTVEELVFDDVRIDARIDPDTFTPTR